MWFASSLYKSRIVFKEKKTETESLRNWNLWLPPDSVWRSWTLTSLLFANIFTHILNSISLSLYLSLTHTHIHIHTHSYTHTLTHIHTHVRFITVKFVFFYFPNVQIECTSKTSTNSSNQHQYAPKYLKLQFNFIWIALSYLSSHKVRCWQHDDWRHSVL